MRAQAKDLMGDAFKSGNFALAEVKYAAGDIKPMVIESVGTAQKRVEIRVDNIAGVKVPVFKPVDTGAVSQDHTGLSKGGQQIARARTTFSKAVDVLVQLATLQTSFVILDEAQNTTATQMKMFLTRMGEGSKIVVTGDTTQIDLPERVKSGLGDAISRLGDVPGVEAVKLSGHDIVRHRLVREIVRAYDDDHKPNRSKK